MNYGKSNVVKKHKELVSTPRRLTTKIMVYMFKVSIFAVLLAVGAAGFLGLGLIKGIIDGAPSIDTINIAPAAEATKIYDSEGNLIEKLVTDGSNRSPVSLEKIPVHLRYAFIDIEDERFETHNGIDIKGIFRAAYQTLQGDMQGASTITQQLLKNNAFEDGGREDSTGALIKRKIQEIYLALQLEENVSKDIILENYLNTINLGSGCYGVQAASQRYFNKDVSELTISESAVIAAITQNPYGYNPIYHPEDNAKRRAHVLEYMLKNDHITKAEYQEAMADNVYDRIQETSTLTADTTPYSFFTDELINQVINDLQEQKAYTYTQAINALYSGGLKIYSTQDTAIQKICDEETNNPDNYPINVAYSFEWQFSVKLAEPDENGNTIKNYSQWSIINYHKNVLGNKKFKLIFNNQEEIDACIEEYKKEIFKEDVEAIGENLIVSIQPQVSFTVIDQHTGYVKALVGGRGEKTTNRALNRATGSTRQPGSCFKVLSTFAPAIDSYGYTIASVVDDSPFYYDNGRLINNWWDKADSPVESRKYRGLQSIRTAIASSMNVITVKVLTDITPSAGYEYLKDFGFTTLIESRKNADGTFDSDINQSLALGGITDGVTNLELCAAYAAIANNGQYTEPLYYTKVLDNSGKIILEREPEKRQVIKESTAYVLTDAMHDVVTNGGTGTKANMKNMYVAGKTGTSSNDYDIWFAGYTPYLTATIWSGYDENKTLSNTSYHLTIWKNIMTRIHEDKGYEYAEFSKPDSVVSAQVCAKCGNLATTGLCDKDPEKNMIKTEIFIAGTVPTEHCVCHEEVAICNDSGLLATANCPNVTKKVFRIRYQGTDGTTWDTPYTLPAELKGSYCTTHN
ncbi:MAG: transglycosylase domain-containing protein [Lachnospiraceae bacterium]|nr:transglycosylase domain-containing protein [Lachnospiraceae bacterium]